MGYNADGSLAFLYSSAIKVEYTSLWCAPLVHFGATGPGGCTQRKKQTILVCKGYRAKLY